MPRMKLSYARPFLESGIGSSLVSGILTFLEHPYAQWFGVAAIVLLVVAMMIVFMVEYRGRREQRGYRKRTRQLLDPTALEPQ